MLYEYMYNENAINLLSLNLRKTKLISFQLPNFLPSSFVCCCCCGGGTTTNHQHVESNQKQHSTPVKNSHALRAFISA